jgi:uncharacterized SAM-binding protein YcdF (DUF218 family)
MLIVKSFATPMVWVLLLLVLGLVLARKGRGKRLSMVGRLLLLTGTVLLWVLSLSPVANFLTYPLESQYRSPPAQALDRLDMVVVLGGGIHPSGHLRQEAELSKFTYPRFYHGVRVFQQNHASLLAFCGGPDREGGESEAETMRAMALSLGVPEGRIVAEETSRTTFENIANLARLLPAGQGRRIGLVTTAIHMRRSCGVFQNQFPGDTIIPIPVYYTYDPAGSFLGNFVPSSGNLEKSSVALHEWIGLVWYKVRGR